MALLDEYTRGAVVQVRGTVTNSGGTAADPGATTLQYRDPRGTVTTLVYNTDAALVRESAGVFYVNISGTISGIWDVRLAGTGDNAGAAEYAFKIKPSRF